MKRKLIESFCLCLFLGSLSSMAIVQDRILREEIPVEISQDEPRLLHETTYDMEGLRKHLLAGASMIAGNTDRVILEYSDFETTDTPFPDSSEASVHIEENDVPEAEAVDLSKIKSNVPNDTKGCKSYKKTHMSYTAITCKSSDQYKLQKKAYTDKKSGIRMVDDCYLIAVGSYYADYVGEKLIVTMENGKQIPCMVGDFKRDDHTDKTHRFHTGGYDKGIYYEGDGSVIEFVVDTDVYEPKKIPKKFDGKIHSIYAEEKED